VLVRVPLEHRDRVEDARQRPRPIEERVATFGVVPRRTQDDEIERLPLDCAVPDRRFGVDPEGVERLDQPREVLVAVGDLGGGSERDPRRAAR
jgi:hypothetical protein